MILQKLLKRPHQVVRVDIIRGEPPNPFQVVSGLNCRLAGDPLFLDNYNRPPAVLGWHHGDPAEFGKAS